MVLTVSPVSPNYDKIFPCSMLVKVLSLVEKVKDFAYLLVHNDLKY